MIVVTKDQIPIPKHLPPLSSQELKLPSSIVSIRSTINNNELMNSLNNLHNYIHALFGVVTSSNADFSSNDDVLKLADTMIILRDIDSGSVPWTNIKKTKSLNWSILDEITISIICRGYLINLITSELLNESLTNIKKPTIDENSFKKISNYLKDSFEYLKLIKQSGYFGKNYSSSFESKFEYIYISNDILFQLNFVFKDFWMIINKIDFDFNNLLKFTTLPVINTLSRLIVYCFNESQKIKNLSLDSSFQNLSFGKKDVFKFKSESSSAASSPSSSSQLESIDTFIMYLQIIYSFYQSIYQYNQSKIGVSLSMVQASLYQSINLDPIRSKLKLKLDKSDKPSELNKKLDKFINKGTKSNDDQLKLNSHLQTQLPGFCQVHLRLLIQLFKNLFIKYQKENDTLYFQPLISIEELDNEYFFKSKNLPNSMNISLPNDKIFSPLKDKQITDSSSNYF